MDHEAAVLEFMRKHNQHVADEPSFPPGSISRALVKSASLFKRFAIMEHEHDPDNVVLLRARLIIEEACEIVEAMYERDLELVADGLADLDYVNVGTAISFGIPHDEVFREVHRSNMTKAPLDRNAKGGKVGKHEVLGTKSFDRMITEIECSDCGWLVLPSPESDHLAPRCPLGYDPPDVAGAIYRGNARRRLANPPKAGF